MTIPQRVIVWLMATITGTVIGLVLAYALAVGLEKL
jgi:hypothetical protein